MQIFSWAMEAGTAGCSKRLPTRPQPKKTPEAYPLGYGEDFSEVRTTLAGVFSSLLEGWFEEA
jgi:hypothetical protein